MNKSLIQVTLGGIRSAGPGTYYPAHVKADGTLVNARYVGRFFANDFYLDGQGNRVDNNSVITLTAWNGKTAPAGKGLADRMAKYCAPGKEIAMAFARLNIYEGRVFSKPDAAGNSAPYNHPDGSLMMVEKTSYVLDGSSLRFGDDSAKQLATEAANFIAEGGKVNFSSRPAGWRTPGSVEAKQWEGISAWRTSQAFNPQFATYGYAKVGAVNGTPVASHAGAAPVNAAAAAGTVVNQPVVNNAATPVAATGGTAIVAGADASAGADFPVAPTHGEEASGGNAY